MIRTITAIAVAVILLSSCTTTRRWGTTIVRDENNPCIINYVVQVAIQGTAEDIRIVRSALESCYNLECFIPCPADTTKGCKTKMSVVVKAYGELKDNERDAFHYVEMVDDDGQPSWAEIGTPNGRSVEGKWRRNQPAQVYCHEVLHFCGLRDQYCARLFDPVTGEIKVERMCEHLPEPNGNCCTPTAQYTRCCETCPGHNDDLMGSMFAALSCQNVFDVLAKAGMNECPEVCCSSDSTFSRPLAETYLMPGYFNFGQKGNKTGGFGVTLGVDYNIGRSMAVTVQGGMHTKKEKQDDFEQTISFPYVTAGISNQISLKPKLSLKPYVLAGIMWCKQRVKYLDEEFTSEESSFHMNAGAALNYVLKKNTFLRLQVEFAPTWFGSEMESNYRVSAGIGLQLKK